jgi:hypothetical protein
MWLRLHSAAQRIAIAYHIAVEPTLQDSIIRAQLHDEGVKIIKQQLAQGEEKYKYFQVDHKGILWFKRRIVVPKDHQLRK